MKLIADKVEERSQRLELIIKARQSTENWLNSVLTIVAAGCIALVWIRMQRFLEGKAGVLGGFGIQMASKDQVL